MRLFGFNPSSPVETESYHRKSIAAEHDEEALEGWLAANPELLLDETLLLFSRQHPLDVGKPDLLALDQFGNLVVFEVKTGRSGTKSASEESIIGQPLTYAQALSTAEYGALDEIYQRYRERVIDGRWYHDPESVSAATLHEAFEGTYGRRLAPDQFNDTQRVVIVAETITERTADNARYLRDQGYHIQCREVQLYERPGQSGGSKSKVSVTNTVVDYPLGDVRPVDKGHPAYPEINRAIIERTFREIGSLVGAETPRDLVQGFDERQPRIRSSAAGHPDTVSYRLYVNPEDDAVLVAIDIDERDEAALAALQGHQAAFAEQGYQMTCNERHRVVIDTWLVDGIGDLDEPLLEEIAARWSLLVRLGHEALTARS